MPLKKKNGKAVTPGAGKKTTLFQQNDNQQTITGSRPNLGVFKTTKERTTVGGIAEPYKYKTESIDTSGYSKGKKVFNLKTVEGESDKLGLSKITRKSFKSVGRKDVPKILKSLKK
jgi:hypothetical protein